MAWNNNGGYNGPRSGGQYRNGNNSNPRAQQPREQQESSSGPTLYNNHAGKFLNFNYWGKFASIEIGVVPAGAPMDWNTRKNAQRITQLISFADLSDLWDICEEVIDSVKTTGTFTSVGLKVGTKQDCIVEINNGSSINMTPGIYLVIYKNIDSGNRTNNLEFYPFTNTKVVRGYNHSSGTAKEDVSKVGEFKKFYRMVKEATKAFTMAAAHTVSSVQKNERMTTFKILSALTASMGVDMTTELAKLHSGSSQGSGNRSYNNNRQQGQSGGRSGYSPMGGGTPRSVGTNNTFEAGNAGSYGQKMTASLDDPVDINLSMDTLTNVDMSQFS